MLQGFRMMASSCSFAAACSTNGATSTQSIPGPGAMEDAGEGSAKGEKRDAIELKSGDRISYRNRGAVVQDDLRLKETQTRANLFSNWKIWENPEHFAWEGPRETGKGDGKKQNLKIDRNDGKGFVYLYSPRKKDPQDAKECRWRVRGRQSAADGRWTRPPEPAAVRPALQV